MSGVGMVAKLGQARRPWQSAELHSMAVKAALDGARAIAAFENGALSTASCALLLLASNMHNWQHAPIAGVARPRCVSDGHCRAACPWTRVYSMSSFPSDTNGL